MNDDGDMAEMYLTEKKLRKETNSSSDQYDHRDTLGGTRRLSESAPVSPVRSIGGVPKLHRAFSTISSSKTGSFLGSTDGGENIDQLEMLLEAYFVFIDTTLTKLLTVRGFYLFRNGYIYIYIVLKSFLKLRNMVNLKES